MFHRSRPSGLVALRCDGEGVDMLTPGHFLIGWPIEVLPDPSFSYCPISLLRRWHLCQNMVRQFWQPWRQEYLAGPWRFTKWHKPTRNISIGDIVVLHDGGMVPIQWPLGKVLKASTGSDGLVRVIEVKTQSGIFTRPVHKIVLLLPTNENWIELDLWHSY